jgi:ankyrin repeat protein
MFSPSEILIFAILLQICQDGNTVLMLAARNGHVEVSQLLLNSKADVNAADQVRASSGDSTLACVG